MSRVLRSGTAIVALLLSLLLVPAVAGAAPNLGNSQYAQACQKGGYLNFLRTNGTAFKNTGDCASYAAKGGVFVPRGPLPDLLLQVDCSTATPLTVTCTFRVINVGTVAVTGPVTLQASLAAPAGVSLTEASAFAVAGAPVLCATFGSTDFTTSVAGASATATCDGTIAPGEQVNVEVQVSGTTALAGVPLTIAAAADPGNTIVESDESNNAYNASITTP